jgi:DsbC/DsbD-like thiol-disulfide interchange protein
MKYIFVMAMLLTFQKVSAQIETPVKWSYAAKKLNNKEAVVFIKATIDKGWHVYSQKTKDGGPVKTTITFKPSKVYSLVGKTTEPTPVTHFEQSFNMDVKYFEQTVIFQQKIKLKSAKAMVKGSLEYMSCNDHKCLPPADLDFSVTVN